ncbi:hypothetical protein ACKKBF_B11690 [Auxenochlorella protothecoides x Auxenochlorella symbiontica]
MSLEGDYSNYTAAQCFGLQDTEHQVACSAQHLNITNPPSIYGYEHYEQLWLSTACLLWNVTTGHRVTVHDDFVWCSVPLQAQDAFLFVGLALLVMATLFGKLSAVWVLITGGVLGIINWQVNLGLISNAISIWLNIQPPDLFFYAFLPPLLVDSAIRIDFFMFRKLSLHAVMMAFVMVVLSALILTPLILFVLGFQDRGWSWVHGALFASMIAPTDALAAAAILKQGGGPERLVVLMEGEALLNDASAITLFEVFMHIIEEHINPAEPYPSVWSILPTIITQTLKLASVGFAIGLAMSWLTFHFLHWLRWRGAKPYVENSVIIAVAYLSFYVANDPAKGSGVISVVVFGLYGNMTSKWGMLSSSEESGAFDAVWDAITFSANGLVFLWSGIAAVNYTVNSVAILNNTAWSYAAIPLIWVFMFFIRAGCLVLFNPIFKWVGEALSTQDIIFTSWCGLRGAVSLIMVADFISNSQFHLGDRNNPEDPYTVLNAVNADISLWTSAFVLLTLVVNAPFIGQIMALLRLNKIPWEKRKMRAKAKAALVRFTSNALEALQTDTDEFLQGANWDAVLAYVDVSTALAAFDLPAKRSESFAEPHGRGLPALYHRVKSAVFGRMNDRGSAVLGNPAVEVADIIPHMVGVRTSAGGVGAVPEGDSPAKGKLVGADTSPNGYTSDSESTASSNFTMSDISDVVEELRGEIPYLHHDGLARTSWHEGSADLEMGLGRATAVPGAALGAPPATLTPRPSPHASSGSLTHGSASAHSGTASFVGERLATPFAAAAGPGPDVRAREEEERYYSTLPALSAAQLGAALRESMAAEQKAAGKRAVGADGEGGDGPVTASPSSAFAPAGAAPQAGAGPRMSAQEEHEAYYSSMPAALGASLGRELRAQLTKRSVDLASAEGMVVGQEKQELVGDERAGGGKEEPERDAQAVVNEEDVIKASVQRAFAAALAGERGAAGGREPVPEAVSHEGDATAQPPSEPPLDYYSSMPAALGRRVAGELAANLAQQTQHAQDATMSLPLGLAPRQPRGRPDVVLGGGDSSGEHDNDDGVQSGTASARMTSQAGKKMQAELARLLAAGRMSSVPEGGEAPPPRQAGRAGEATWRAMQEEGEETESVAKAEGAADDGRAQENNEAHGSEGTGDRSSSSQSAETVALLAPAEAPPSDAQEPAPQARPEEGTQANHFSTMPAQMGRALQARLLQELAKQRSIEMTRPPPQQQPGAVAARPPRPSRASRATSADMRGTDWDAHATVSGVMGRNLRQELERSRANLPGHSASFNSQQTLLGKKTAETSLPSTHLDVTPFARPIASHQTHIHHKRGGSGSAAHGNTPFSNVLAKHRLAHTRGPSIDTIPEAPVAATPRPLRAQAEESLTPRSQDGRPRGGTPVNVVESVVARSWQNKVDKASLHKLPLRAGLPMMAMLGTTPSADLVSHTGSRDLGRLSGHLARARSADALTPRSLPGDSEPQSPDGSFAGLGGEGPESGASLRPVLSEEATDEMRGRLVSGLKRYFHGKRLQGLLSIKGLRILDYACDHAAEHVDRPFAIWQSLQKEIKGDLVTRCLARLLMWMARAFRASPAWLQWTVQWPVRKLTGIMRAALGRRMLVACEVAVEYYLSLLWSPQVSWLKEVDGAADLLAEVEVETDAAYRFIIDREIEAPDRFGAIQSYRAAMALLRQQFTFIEELYDSGMVDHGEQKMMVDAVDKKARHLEITGPVWKPPRHRSLMRSLPFMSGLSEAYFRRIFAAGTIREFATGEAFWASSDVVADSGRREGPGAFMVLSGVVKQIHVAPDGTRREYYQGIGGVVGLVLMLTGSYLPGRQMAVAEGNVLGKGPVLFHLPQHVAMTLRSQAASGLADAQRLEASLARLAGVYAIQGMEREVRDDVAQHLLRLTTARVQHSMRRQASGSGSGGGGGTARGAEAGADLARASVRPGGGVDRGLASVMQDLAAAELRALEREGAGAPDGQADDASARGGDDTAPRGGGGGEDSDGASSSVGTAEGSFSSRRPLLGARALNSGEAGAPRARGSGSGEGTLRARARAAVRKAPVHGDEVLEAMRRSLPSAVVLFLPPGREMVQTSHMVLIGGSLHHAKPRGGGGLPDSGHVATTATNTGERWGVVIAPRPLPWLANPGLRCNRHVPRYMLLSQRWVGGNQGALIVAGLTSEGERPIAAQHFDMYGAGAGAAASVGAPYLTRSATLDWQDATPATENGAAGAAGPTRRVSATPRARPPGLLTRIRRIRTSSTN